jgi:hypothetical protein
MLDKTVGYMTNRWKTYKNKTLKIVLICNQSEVKYYALVAPMYRNDNRAKYICQIFDWLYENMEAD